MRESNQCSIKSIVSGKISYKKFVNQYVGKENEWKMYWLFECKSLETITLPKSAALGENIFTDYRPIKTIRYTGTREEWVAAGLNQNNFYNATVYYEYTADHKHTFVTYTYTYTNSCTEPGERVTKCKDCGYIQLKETLPAQGHDWEVVSEKKATCKAEGLRNLKLKKNQTVTLKAAAAPLTSIQKLKYKSSNKKIVTVTSKGVVKAKKKGKAVITVQSGSKTVKCKVTVK